MGGKPRSKTSESATKDGPSDSDKGKSGPGPRSGRGDRPSADGDKRPSGDARNQGKDAKDQSKGEAKGADGSAGKGERKGGGSREGADEPRGEKSSGDKSKGSKGVGDRNRGPRTSREYSAEELRATGKENWKTERDGHTRRAWKAARAEVKEATGKDAKLPAKGDQYHHHAGVAEAKKVGLNPDVAGERERLTAVSTKKGPNVYGGEVRPDKDGTVADTEVAKRDRRTHHTVASRIDKAEQARTAQRMGVTGDKPELPRSDAGRKGMVDASGTSKWRWPADQTERAKQDWKREPSGNATAEQSRRAKEKLRAWQAKKKTKGAAESRDGAKPGKSPTRGSDVPKKGSKADASKTRGKKDAPGKSSKADSSRPGAGHDRREAPRKEVDAPKARPKTDAPKAAGTDAPARTPRVKDAVKKIEKTVRVAGAVGNAVSFASDMYQVIARHSPELLPDGTSVELRRPHKDLPFIAEPTGYRVEKTDGRVIYRGPDGGAVSKEEALESTEWRGGLPKRIET